jgi:hypothetical protein
MTQALEKGHVLLEAKSDALRINIDEVVARISQAAAEPAAQGVKEPPAPPGLVNQQIEYLQTSVTGMGARLQVAEVKAEVFEAAITDVQGKVSSMAAASSRTVGAADPWQPQPTGAVPVAATSPERFDMSGGFGGGGSGGDGFGGGTGERRSFGWKLYDEKYLFQPSSAFTGKDGSGWLLSLRDYLAGRTAELDRLFDHIEKMGEEAENDIG